MSAREIVSVDGEIVDLRVGRISVMGLQLYPEELYERGLDGDCAE